MMKRFSEFLKEQHGNDITIYLDMDGVIVDFDKSARKLIKNYDMQKPYFNGDLPSTPEYEKLRINLRFAVGRTKNFWKDLEWTEDGKPLAKFILKNFSIEDIYILTTHMPTDPTSCPGKKEWIQREVPKIKRNHVICEAKKHRHVSSLMGRQILIDDRKKNIGDWVNAGGIGILHTSTENTINELKKYLSGEK